MCERDERSARQFARNSLCARGRAKFLDRVYFFCTARVKNVIFGIFHKYSRKLSKTTENGNSKDARKTLEILKMREAILINPIGIEMRVNFSRGIFSQFLS